MLETWPAGWRNTLTDAALTQASSAAIFQRGRAYAASGVVHVIAEDPLPEPALRACVEGSDSYTTEVWIEDNAIAGGCDCPNAEDGWFCKHQVALALVWRARLSGMASSAAKPTPQPLEAFLHSQSASVLADKLLALAADDADIALGLTRWQALGNITAVDDRAPSDLMTVIAELLTANDDHFRTRRNHRHRHWDDSPSSNATDYAERGDAVLVLLAQARQHSPDSAAALCLHALHSAWEALAVVEEDEEDDEGETYGDISDVCSQIGSEWVAALVQAGPQPAAFGDIYLDALLADPVGSFDSDAVEAAMGEAALAQYRHILAECWGVAKDPALRPLHLAQLEKTGQIDAALAIMRSDLSDGGAHVAIVELLERHGRNAEALAQARLGLQAVPRDWALPDVLLRCLEREGLTAEVLALRRRLFEAQPSVARYHAVLEAGTADGCDRAALRQALMSVMAAKQVARPGLQHEVSLRAEILGTEGRWEEAAQLVQAPARCQNEVLLGIARHLGDGQNETALALLLRVFNEQMTRANSPYRAELALVAEIGGRMQAAQWAEWLAQLRISFKAKRNFMRDLPTL